jgi:SWI/SNF-related matrix-associated actin-dependent regulator of chromatin subfamily A-like protein 1
MTELKQFQYEGCRRIYGFKGRALLADEMGLGKTIQALYWIKKTPSHRPVVIITPATVKYTWQAEAAMHFGFRTEVIEGKRKKRVRTLPGPICIINYELLSSWLPVLLKSQPSILIIDEIHYCKNPRAARTKCTKKIAESARSVIGLSGTPLVNKPAELWSVLSIIRPDLFPSFQKYAWKYCQPRHTPWGWKYDGAANLKQLRGILTSKVMIRRLKKDVLTELPDKVRRFAIVNLSTKGRKEYDKASYDFLSWLRKISPTKAKKAKKSEALTKIGYLLRLTAKLKLEWTEKWIKEFFESHPAKKLVAMTMNTFVIDHLKARFKSKAVVIDGRIKGRHRTETVRKFQNNRQVSLLLGNWKAAGVGITLTASHNIVALDFPWTPGDLIQGEDRVHRIGQKHNVTVHYLATLNTIEERLINILQRKSKILDAILNGTKAAQDLNIFDALLKEELKQEPDNNRKQKKKNA